MTEPALPSLHATDEFAGRVVLVTAAAGQGIGQAVARRFAAGGATVVVTDSHERRTHEVAEAIGADYPKVRVVGRAMDAGDRASIDRVIDTVVDDFNRVDILVNNAAVNVLGSHFEFGFEDWDRVLRVNLTGPWWLCRRLLPLMRDGGRGGVIVNVSSYAPDVGGNGKESPYAITKGGLNVLTRSVAHEGGPHGIRAVTVAMGVVRGTKFTDDHPEILQDPESQGVLPWLPTAADIAETVAFVASDRARCITGESINVASGSYMRI